jgi:hypothetical protein
MFSLFKRSRHGQSRTFKTRVIDFWGWFAKNAERFYEMIEVKRCNELHAEVSARMDALMPGAAWVFGPGVNGSGHSFTFTGEGDPRRQLLAAYWLTQAPSLAGWTFHATKQRMPDISGHRIHFNDLVFNPLEFWLTTYVDEEDEAIDLTVWHPAFPQMAERTRWTAIFLYLDEVLGELGTQNWINEIKVSDSQLAEAMPLTELASYVDGVVAKHGWKYRLPGDSWSSYQYKEPKRGTLRDDIIAGTTCIFPFVQAVKKGHVETDPVEGSGADFVYVVVPRGKLPTGEEVSARGVIEEALVQRLAPAAAGQFLGGAVGLDHAYVDLLLFDGRSSLDMVADVLREQGFGPGTSIEFFAKDRASERVRL